MTTYWRNMGKIGRDAWIVLACYAVMGFGHHGIEAAILNLFYLRLGLGPEFVGLNMGITALGFALAALPAAVIVGRIGGRQAMTVGILGQATAIVALSFGAYLPEAALQLSMHALRLLAAAFMALYMVASLPLLMAVTGPEERPLAFALLWSLNPLGGLLGNLVGGLLPGALASLGGTSLADPRPYGYSIALGMLVCIPLALATRTLREGGRPPPKEKTEGARNLVPYATLAAIGAISLLRAGGEASARTFFNVYLDRVLLISTAHIGATMALANLLTIPAALVMPAIAQRGGKFPSLMLTIVGVACSLVLLAFSGSWAMAGLAFVAVYVLAAMFRVVWTLLAQEAVEAQWRPMSSAIGGLAAGLGYSLMSGSGGYMVPITGYRGVFMAGAFLVALGALTVWGYFGRMPAVASQAPQA